MRQEKGYDSAMIHQDGIVVGIAALIVAQLDEAKERRKVERRLKSPLINIETSQRHRQRGTTVTEMVNRTLKSNPPLRIQKKAQGKNNRYQEKSWENKIDHDRNKNSNTMISHVAIILNKLGQLSRHLFISNAHPQSCKMQDSIGPTITYDLNDP